MIRTLLRLLPVLALCWLPARAETIYYSDSGTFSEPVGTDALAFTAPGGTWAFHFEADVNPTITEFGMGGFDFVFSDFSYSLNGKNVPITPDFIRFFSGPNGGAYEICFTGTNAQNCTDGLGAYGAQMYTGMTSAPTLSTGAFTSDSFGFVLDSSFYSEPNNTVLASTPEPATLLTLAAGLLVLSGRRRRK